MKKRDRARPRPAKITVKEKTRRDRQRDAAMKWCGVPPGIPTGLRLKFERRIKDGKSISDLTKPSSEWFLVPHSRFRKHCQLHPEWAPDIYKISKANGNKKKLGPKSDFCRKGLHPMKVPNLLFDQRGYRRCRACTNEGTFGRPIPDEVIERFKRALEEGAALAQIVWGRPMGGGPFDRSLIIVNSSKFYYRCRTDPEFSAFVQKHIADSNTVAQSLRHAKARGVPPELTPTVIALARLKHGIRQKVRSDTHRPGGS